MRQLRSLRFVNLRTTLLACPAVAVWVCLAAPTVRANTLTQKKADARTQFERAETLRTAIEGKPTDARTLQEYLHLVAVYRRVYLITPQASQVTPAIVAVAELYQEIGRQFDPQYFNSAIDTYRFLLHEYPTSRYAQEALFAIGQIQRDDMDELDAAQQTFQQFLTRFPKSEKAAQARQALEELAVNGKEEDGADTRARVSEEVERDRELPRVTSIRHWNAENYTRIVIDLEGGVKFQGARIPNPDRIYFDLYSARLSPGLSGKTLEVGDGFLKAIRVAQNKAGVVRVVLDADKVKDYSAFLLPNPYRLVIDVRGEVPTVTKASVARPPAVAEAAPKPEREPGVVPSAVRVPARPLRPGSLPTAREAAAALGPAPAPRPTHNGESTLTRALGLKIGRIVIDPGHGGHDTGTIGPGGLMEKDLCLDVALRLGKLIQTRLPGAEVIYTRNDDTFIPLENRTAIANQEKADLFISIHANSSRDHKARGVETYYLNFATSQDALEVAARENALSQSSIHELQDLIKQIAKNDKVEESRELAIDLQDSLIGELKQSRQSLKSRGVKKAPFVVLIGANMPSVLSEISFLSNPGDERLLKKPAQRERVAEGLFDGIQKYLASLNSISYNLPKEAAATH